MSLPEEIYPPADTPLTVSLRWFSIFSCVAVITVGILVLIGWASDNTFLKSIEPSFTAMNPTTAIAFIFLGFSLLQLQKEPKKPGTRVPTLAGFCFMAVIVIAAVRLAGYWLGWDFGIDNLFFRAKLAGNRMAPNTAFNFIFVCFALMVLDAETGRRRRPAQYLACFVGLTSLLVMTGYAYKIISFTRMAEAYIPMAFHTAVSFLILSLGILASRPTRGLMAVVTDQSVAGSVARSLLSTAIFLPIVLSILSLQGQRAGFYEMEVGLGLFTMSNIIIFTIVIWWNAGILYRLDRERRQSDMDLKEANEKLTGWVGELKERNLETSLLVQLGELLQTCVSVEEASRVIASSAHKLFPDFSGGLYLLNENRTLVENASKWGDFSGEVMFAPEDCLALRSGRIYVVKGEPDELLCRHLGGRAAADYLCVPMMAQGESVGLFHLRPAPSSRTGLTEAKKQLASAVAEQVGLAFSNIKLRATLRDQAIRDPLTRLFNRRYMEEFLELELRRAKRGGRPIGLILADIDHFKKFNDTLGHEAGDALLIALSGFFQTHVRGYDIACRYGGEEFVMILPEASLENSRKRAESLRETAKRLEVRYLDKPLGMVTLSFGVAVYPDHGQTSEALLRAADAALYRAKAEGRDRVVTQVQPL